MASCRRIRMPPCCSTAGNRDESGGRPSVNIPDIRLNLLELLCSPRATCTGSRHIRPDWYVYHTPVHVLTPVTQIVHPDAGAIDVKHSTFKNVKSFLKASAKEGLLKLKETKGDVVVTAVHPQHPAVAGKRPHRTIGDLEAKAKKEEDREQKEKEAQEKRRGEIHVAELWKPFGTTVPLFVAAEKE